VLPGEQAVSKMDKNSPLKPAQGFALGKDSSRLERLFQGASNAGHYSTFGSKQMVHV